MGNKNQKLRSFMLNELIRMLILLLGAVMIAGLMLSIGGCTKRVYVPVESITERTDTVWQTREVCTTDTLRLVERLTELRTDSIAPRLDSLGRMTGWDHWRIIDRSASLQTECIRLRQSVDSLQRIASTTETIREPYPVEVIKEEPRKRSWWETILNWTGGLAIGSVVCYVATMIARVVKKYC